MNNVFSSRLIYLSQTRNHFKGLNLWNFLGDGSGSETYYQEVNLCNFLESYLETFLSTCFFCDCYFSKTSEAIKVALTATCKISEWRLAKDFEGFHRKNNYKVSWILHGTHVLNGCTSLPFLKQISIIKHNDAKRVVYWRRNPQLESKTPFWKDWRCRNDLNFAHVENFKVLDLNHKQQIS